MSKISISEIEKVSKLARIEINPVEQESLSIDASSILDFAEAIQSTDAEGVEPTSQVTGLTDVWREDEVVKSEVSPEELLAGAPDSVEGYVKVKKVL
jgi:aspartyl-tRNA(Asn)/glutamyl-tRNA(Gln) amidotransferase subunit C